MRRKVLSNAGITFTHRLYAPLGAGLWMAKTCGPLPKLLQRSSTYSRAHVRPECQDAMRRICALASAPWARTLLDGAFWPTAEHIHLIDKRFGGELTRADVLGTDAEEEDGPDAAAVMKGGTTVAGSVVGGRADMTRLKSVGGASSRSGKSSKYGSRVKKEVVAKRWRIPRLPPLDMANQMFEIRRAQSAAARAARTVEVRSSRPALPTCWCATSVPLL